MDIFKLYRKFWDYCFENPELIRPTHVAIYSFTIEHCNRLGWKKKFGLPSTMVMEAIGVKSYGTYINALRELVDWGFIEMIEKSKNQYSSNIVALSNFDKALDNALDKAIIKQQQSTVSIDKPINNKQETVNPFDLHEPLNQDVKDKPNFDKINWELFIDFFNNTFGKKSRIIPSKIKKSYEARIKEGYLKTDIMNAMTNASKDSFHIENNFKFCTLEFFSRPDKLDKFSSIDNSNTTNETRHFNFPKISIRIAHDALNNPLLMENFNSRGASRDFIQGIANGTIAPTGDDGY